MYALRTAVRIPARNARGLATTSVRSKTLSDSVKDAAETVANKASQAAASAQAAVNDAAKAATEQAGKAAAAMKDVLGENAPTEGQIKDKVADAKESANATLGDAAGKAQQGKQNVKRKV